MMYMPIRGTKMVLIDQEMYMSFVLIQHKVCIAVIIHICHSYEEICELLYLCIYCAHNH